MSPTRRWRRPGWFRVNTMAARLSIAVIVGSALWFLIQSDFFVLVPGFVFSNGAIWEPFTYAFIASDPLSVIFGALVIWSIGSALEVTWGPKRLLYVVYGNTALAGIITTLIALVDPTMRSHAFFGAWVMGTIVWVAYGLSYGRGQTNFWGIPISGNVLALIGIGFVVLRGFYARDWRPIAPEVIGIALIIGYLKMGSPRMWLLRFQSWRLQRQLRARSTHLRLIAKDRNTPRDSDRYLH